MKDILQKLLAAFDVEHREHLERIRSYLASLEPGHMPDPKDVTIAEAFRCAHSLKGASRVVDLRAITELAHRLEALFARIQSGKASISPKFLTTIARVMDCIEDIVAASRSGQTLPETQSLLSDLEALIEGNALTPSAATSTAPATPDFGIPGEARSGVDSKSAAESLPPGNAALTNADIRSSIPPRPEKKPFLNVVQAPTPSVPSPLERPAPVAAVPSPAATSSPFAAVARSGANFDTMRLSAEHFDRLIKTAGEVISFSRNQDENASHLKEMSHALRGIEKEWGLVQKTSSSFLRQLTADADKTRLVKYLDFVETQIRSISRQLRSVSAEQKNDNFSLRRLGEQLQDDVQTARLMPAADVYESFSKMMRDIAKDEGKELEFKMLGLDIEADRVVLQALKDPLMHILRNALSHGIESPQRREAQGKPRAGKITLHLGITGRRLSLVIADDGQGIQLESIRKKALDADLVNADELMTMAADEVRRLIFHPGFSTAPEVTEISGRGIGLSVVKDAVERLQGDVSIESQAGKDCSFTISVPLSLSTHRLLLLKCQGQTIALPTHAVQSVQRAKSQDIATVEGRPVIRVKGIMVPVMALSQLLGMKDISVKPTEDTLSFAILKFGEKRLAVAVDRLLGEREGLIKDLGPPMTRSTRFAGGLLLDRSSIALVVNPPALFEAYHQLRQGQPLQITQRQEQRQKIRVLVVDDSFTTRILEKSILESKGYQVNVAVDGMEALAFLKTHEVDLIISDVEMPRMDGLTLLKSVRDHPKLAKIPVIMVSSRDSKEDQERGLHLGADAYLPKQEFNQKILLDTIRQVI